MDTLYSWEIRRSGGAMSITHSCGKITGIALVNSVGGNIVAVDGTGRKYRLHVGPKA